MGTPSGNSVKEHSAAARRHQPPVAPIATNAAAASFDSLTHKLDYLDPSEIRRVRDAYGFADEAHLG